MNDKAIKGAIASMELGHRLLAEAKPKDALEFYKRAEIIFDQERSWLGIAQIQDAKSYAFYGLDDHTQAIANAESAIQLYLSNNHELEAAKLLSHLGSVFRSDGNYDKAQLSYNEAKSIFVKLKDGAQAVDIETKQASLLMFQGNPTESLQRLAEVKLYHQKDNNIAQIVAVDHEMAVANVFLKNYHNANDLFESCKKYYEKTNQTSLIADILKNQALIHNTKLEYRRALELINEALDIFISVNDKPNIARSLLNKVTILLNLNLKEEAFQNCETAKAIFKESGLSFELGKAELSEAEIALWCRQFKRAIKLLDRAQDALAQNKYELCRVISNKALLYYATGDYEKALEMRQLEKKLMIECQNHWDATVVDIGIARILIRQNRHKEAIAILNDSVKLFPNLLKDTWQIPSYFGDAYQPVNIDRSTEYYKNSIEIIESYRTDVELNHRLYYFEDKTPVYRSLIENLTTQNRLVEAIHYSEKSRARWFVDAVNEKRIKTGDNYSIPFIDVYDMDLDLLRKLYGEDCILLYIAVTGKSVRLFIIDVRGKISVGTIPETDQNLIKLLQDTLPYFNAKSFQDMDKLEIPEPFFNFFSAIYQAILENIDPNKILVIFPNTIFNLFPFNAFPRVVKINGKEQIRFIIEDYAIVRAPSITMLNYARRLKGAEKSRALVLGNPKPPGNLIFGEKEAMEVARMLNIEPVLKEGACFNNFIEKSQDTHLIHIASHGIFVEKDLSNSGIALSDGILSVEQIMSLNLNASLVTLPCCESGITTVTINDDWMNVVRAFLMGSKSVLAGLWDIEDEASQGIILDFYRYWLMGGHDKARALQKAQVNYINEARRKAQEEKESIFTLEFRGKENRKLHPYYWAGLQLFGDWE